MNYISQTPIPADQMHSFLKDKQAWENAIGMYQGPDPLDHWYNYVCWYENHGHGDPENKFRETLERCLTLFEHNEYYKQDPRMTRLWLKYIDMQNNPLHFYQVLYQRGVGRQLAIFYMNWAAYYESVQAPKEAESVYNLGFQEKAQPYVELHHAYNKFVYTRNAAALQQQQQQTQAQAQAEQPKSIASAAVAAATAASQYALQLHHGQVSQTQSYRQTHATATYAATTQTHLQHQTQQHQAHHLYHHHHQQQLQQQQPHVSYQQQQPLPQTHPTLTLHTHTNHQHPHQQQQQHNQQHPNPHHQHQQPHTHLHQPTPPQHSHLHTTTNTQQQQQHDHQLAAQQQQHVHQHQQQAQAQPQPLNHQPQSSHHHQHNQSNQHPNHLQTQPPHATTTEVDVAVTSSSATSSAAAAVHYHLQQQQAQHMNGMATSGALYQAQQQHLQQQQQAAITTAAQVQQHYERVQHELNSAEANTTPPTLTTTTIAVEPTLELNMSIPGIRLPRRFAAYCRNNYETWKPALFLEEPADPCRSCHYAKNLVYPGDGCEYSPEELRMQRYAARIAALRRLEGATTQLPQQQQQHQLQADTSDGALSQAQQYEGYYDGLEQTQEQASLGVQQQLQHDQQQQYAFNGGAYHANDSEQDNSEANGEDEYEQDDFEEPEEDEEEATAVGEEDDEEEGDDEDENERRNQQLQMLQQQHLEQQHQQQLLLQQQQQQQFNRSIASNVAAATSVSDDVEDQIEASTIRFSQNKTIKIKFRKERSQTGDSFNGSSNYSAYTIENIYQHEIASPTSLEEQVTRRNGHSFHPYIMGQTSTPKTSAKRSKTKLKRASKFQAINCSSSNSSSTENATVPSTNALATIENLHGVVAEAESATPLTNSNHGVANGSSSVVDGVGSGGCGVGSGGSGSGSSGSGMNHTIQNANYNDNANYSFLSAAALENSNCSLTSAVDRLNFRDATVLANNTATNHHNNNNNTNNNNNVADFSTYQENSYFATQHDTEAKERRLQKALDAIERHLAKDAIDPFSSELCRAFLTKLDFPGSEDANANYKIIQTPLPKIANSRALTLPDGLHFNIDKEVGRGSYGSVYKATDANSGAVVALKFQKPPNTWEIYICDQVLKRVKSPNVLPGLMDVSTAIIAPNASLIATEFSPFGSLLDINNKIRQATSKVMHESLVMHFAAQICNIIHHLHRQHIIHADIKPDNFLLMRIPNTDLHCPSLRLIDFGCAIDMTLFPDSEHTKFRKVIQTDGFTCIEMQEGRPWSYETDLFCIAGTIHVMLMGEYMQLQKRTGIWDIKQKLPRYLKKHVWTKFFGGMLNIRSDSDSDSDNVLPNLCELRDIFDEEATKMDSELQKQIRMLSNILYKR